MTIEGEVKGLQKLRMFRDVDAATLKLVAMSSDHVTFAPGERIFAQGQDSDAAYIILDGEVRMNVDPQRDPPVELRRTGATLLGQVGIICGKARSMSLSAATSVTALRIAAEDFKRLVKETPDFGFAVMRELAEHLDESTRLAADIAPAHWRVKT